MKIPSWMLMISISMFSFWLLDSFHTSTPYTIAEVNANTLITNSSIAEEVHINEFFQVPSNVDTFIILIVNEAHESWFDEKHKLITDKNSHYLPSNLTINEGTKLVFLNADAPWDTPHPHQISIFDYKNSSSLHDGQKQTDDEESHSQLTSNFTTRVMQYSENSSTISLDPGKYIIKNTDYEAKDGFITVLQTDNNGSKPAENLIMGGFYTPTNKVENNKDNDGNTHPGNLNYYRQVFDQQGLKIISEYNFTYSGCNYCPGGFWPDNKASEHTLIIYQTALPLTKVVEILKELVRDNVYI